MPELLDLHLNPQKSVDWALPHDSELYNNEAHLCTHKMLTLIQYKDESTAVVIRKYGTGILHAGDA